MILLLLPSSGYTPFAYLTFPYVIIAGVRQVFTMGPEEGRQGLTAETLQTLLREGMAQFLSEEEARMNVSRRVGVCEAPLERLH
jgi:hypothetical protein